MLIKKLLKFFELRALPPQGLDVTEKKNFLKKYIQVNLLFILKELKHNFPA